MQYSQQMTSQQISHQLPLQEVNGNRSRAYSNALQPLKEMHPPYEEAGLKFLDYKKGRRDLPSWMKYD